MRVERDWLRNLIFSGKDSRRFTQDSPVMPDVWLIAGMFFCRDLTARVDFLLTPYKDETPARLATELRRRLDHLPGRSGASSSKQPKGVHEEEDLIWIDGRPQRRVVLRTDPQISVNQTGVAAALTLREIIACALPLTPWWSRNVVSPTTGVVDRTTETKAEAEFLWLQRVVGVLLLCGSSQVLRGKEIARENESPAFLSSDEAHRLYRATRGEALEFARIMDSPAAQQRVYRVLLDSAGPPSAVPMLWKINLNRSAYVSIARSVPTTKADAARRVFEIDCSGLCWAVADSGIDATHKALRDNSDASRVTRAYDFRGLRELLQVSSDSNATSAETPSTFDSEERERLAKQDRIRIRSGRLLDWNDLLPRITLPSDAGERIPAYDHGTHVAGIIGARKLSAADEREGMCPDIKLCDLRVLDGQGRGDEFSIIAALQFIRFLNAHSDRRVIHGVNLSLSILHDVENYACGRSPICEECERVVNSGVVVVAAAGNQGYERVLTSSGEFEAYRSISITDPGNCEAVITVGSTHRFEPHTYGTSYFSSRGPTGDGRIKPDVLAPGEKIESTVLNQDYGAKDGTSMAAPHVSGVAALLMARHVELMGRPVEIKRIICSSATDLQRERYFQGSGLVDALRALQSV